MKVFLMKLSIFNAKKVFTKLSDIFTKDDLIKGDSNYFKVCTKFKFVSHLASIDPRIMAHA